MDITNIDGYQYHGKQIDIFGDEHEVTVDTDAHIVQGDLFQWQQDQDNLKIFSENSSKTIDNTITL